MPKLSVKIVMQTNATFRDEVIHLVDEESRESPDVTLTIQDATELRQELNEAIKRAGRALSSEAP